MLDLQLLEFLFLLLEKQKWESHFFYLHLFLPDDFQDSVKSTGREKNYEGKGAYFPFSLFIVSDPRSLHDEIVSPHPMRIIVLKFNTDSLGSRLSLTPDSKNPCQFTVNSEGIVELNSHSQCLQKGILKHLQHLKTVGEKFWHQHVWHAALRQEAF